MIVAIPSPYTIYLKQFKTR